MTQLLKDLPMREYHEIEACSKSLLAELISGTPHQAYAKYLDPDRHPVMDEDEEYPHYALYKENSKKHFDVGTAVHCYVLEPDNFDKYVAIVPELNLRTKDGKEAFDAFLELRQNVAIITQDDMDDIQEAAKNIMAMKTTEVVLNQSGFVESTLLWERPNGTKMKCRPDFVNPDMDYVVDVKSAESANKDKFYWNMRNFKYYLSHGITAEGYEAHFGRPLKAYIYLVIEKKTNLVAYYNSELDCFQKAQEEMETGIKIYEECLASGIWPGYPDEIVPITLER